ncbi:MAG TPA: orotate phosphoribosyltransferase [Candidatus Eisenbacteria bacterium]|uniref:Orotate phosphoribosyltransferase n=1 Tax=Eiseniibacteriota bacterium TaxID=2212470 RepID=A0A7V2AWD9_UNCEI|nr:orotate phosphoribosyltransferase [Candidatus Eisenbacteria bacterium]
MTEREELKAILEKRSIMKGEFTLVSGKKSSYYINGKMTTLNSRGLYLAAKLLLDECEGLTYDGFAGPTIGADPVIGALLILSAERGLDKEGFLIRKKSKEHGTRNLVEGKMERGTRVILLEDVATTGGSLIRAADAVRDGGGEIVAVFTIVDREEGAAEAIAEAGYNFRSLYKVRELL